MITENKRTTSSSRLPSCFVPPLSSLTRNNPIWLYTRTPCGANVTQTLFLIRNAKRGRTQNEAIPCCRGEQNDRSMHVVQLKQICLSVYMYVCAREPLAISFPSTLTRTFVDMTRLSALLNLMARNAVTFASFAHSYLRMSNNMDGHAVQTRGMREHRAKPLLAQHVAQNFP